jgi:hypothetical protein
MTDVFIGNATKQILEFAYKLPERKLVTQRVGVFKQVRLAVDCSQKDIDAIFEQWGKYGLVNATEIESVRKDFEGYLISVGKPIASEKLARATHYREDVLVERGKQLRKDAAIAMMNTIENETGQIAKNYEVSVAEIEPRAGFTNPDDSHVAEGFRAEREERPQSPPN